MPDNSTPRGKNGRPTFLGFVAIFVVVIAIFGMLIHGQAQSAQPSDSISSLPLPAQDVLSAMPFTGGNMNSVATEVEENTGHDAWAGSGQYPGTITTVPGTLGSSIVTWTLPNTSNVWGGKSVTFKWRISADGTHLWSENSNAEVLSTFTN